MKWVDYLRQGFCIAGLILCVGGLTACDKAVSGLVEGVSHIVPPTSFSATQAQVSVALSWELPSLESFTHVKVCRTTDTFSTSPEVGTPIYSGS